MFKNYSLALCLFLFISCGSEDDFTPLNIEISADSVTLNQNSSIDIFILQNDSNLPNSGTLTFTNPTKGNLVVNDPNNTPSNPLDDNVTYTTFANTTGEDSFQYTICDETNNCSTGTVSITIISLSVVNYDLDNYPFSTLSEYNFFQGNLKDLNPNYGVLPYTLNSKLFTDYANKKRFVWLPNNTNASYVADGDLLTFPVGAILIKNFYYENVLPNYSTQLIETRLMIKKSDGWVFADYVWNNEQTEATLDLNGSFVNIEWELGGQVNNVNYRIPSAAECVTCHKITEVPFPIGTKPRNLNLMYDYADGTQNQIDKWVDFGYLESSTPTPTTSVVDYNDISAPLEERVRAYLDINCAHCHADEGHCDYRPIRLDYESTSNYTNLGVCVDPDTDLGLGLGHIIEPGDAENSVLFFRFSTTDESNRMPLLGRSVVDDKAVEMIELWINELSNECE